MINRHSLACPDVEIAADIAGQHPIFLHAAKNSDEACYSHSLPELLATIQTSPTLSSEGISYLLQNGIVPAPYTIYRDIFVLGSGDSCMLGVTDEKVKATFSYQYPFSIENIQKRAATTFTDEALDKKILELTFASIQREFDTSRAGFLFHSAGKDSNTVALAIAEGGWQNHVTLITQKSPGDSDESEISKNIAKKLGFKHQVMPQRLRFDQSEQEQILAFLGATPLPSLDNVTLAYALYTLDVPGLTGANMIDGSGNDRYLHNAPKAKNRHLPVVPSFSKARRFLRQFNNSGKAWVSALSTPAERFGLQGFSFKDSASIFPQAHNVYDFWEQQCLQRADYSLADFRADIRGYHLVPGMHALKVRNAADAWNAKLLLPLADPELVALFDTLPESLHFELAKERNKIALRNLLKRKLDLDSDALGKMGYTYDSRSVLRNNKKWMDSIILNCSLWHASGINKLLNNLNAGIARNKSHSFRLYYRLFLLSAWSYSHPNVINP